MARPVNRLVGIVVTDDLAGFRFARTVGCANPAKVLRNLRSGCPVAVRFEMLVEGSTDTYRALRARLTRAPGVHQMGTKLHSWFVYNEPFVELVNEWCEDMSQRGLIRPSALAAQWIGVEYDTKMSKTPPTAVAVANDS